MPRASAAWRLSFRLIYSFLRLLDPVLRLWWHAFGIGITAELTVRGHHSGRERSVLVGLLLPPRAIGLRVHNLVALANDPVGRTGWVRLKTSFTERRSRRRFRVERQMS